MTDKTTIKAAIGMQELARADIARRQAATFKELNAPETFARTFSIDAFRQDFLPYFSGAEKATEEVYSAWLSVAGDRFKSVILVDANNQRVTTVPPLATNMVINPLREERRKTPDVDTLATQTLAQAQLAPMAANANFHNGLISRFAPERKETPSELVTAWKEFLDFFGGTAKDNKTPQASSEAQAPELNYDNDDF